MNIKLGLYILVAMIWSGGNAYKILVAFPVGSKSIHDLMSSVGLALAEAGHSVTHWSSFDAYITHPNVEHFQPNDFSSDLQVRNLFDVNTQAALYSWVKTILTTILHKIWKDPQVWELYHRRNDFDAIISTSYANEALLPFLDGFDGTYVMVCLSGVEHNCLSYSGHWATGAVIPHMSVPYDEFMTFFERIQNSAAFAIEKLFEIVILLPTFREAIQTYFPNITNARSYYNRNHLTLINGHFSLDSPVPLLPKQVEIGTINAKKPKPLPQDLEAFYATAGDAGVLYLSLGSFISGKDIPAKHKATLVETFRRIPHKVVWKYEGDDDLDLPPNVITRKWLPQQDILGHPRTKIFMSHCGNLGTQEAKFHGVPVLAVPIAFDQPRNAARMARKGYGVVVTWDQMTVETLLDAIETLTKDSVYYDRMQAVSQVVQDQKDLPSARAVWWVEYAIRHKGAPQLQYAGQRLHFLQYIMVDVVAFWVAALALLVVAFLWTCRRMTRKCFPSHAKQKRQ